MSGKFMSLRQMKDAKIKIGKVCRVCDRKFFMVQIYHQYAEELTKINNQTEVTREELQIKQ